MAMKNFGAATLFAVPIGGGNPFKFGTLQDVNVTIKRDKKKMFGRGSFATDIGLGQGEITVKAKHGTIQASIIALLTGISASTGHTAVIEDELATVPGSVSYIVTVANAATFGTDLGVRYKTGGLMLQQVASAPAAGQYSVNTSTGVYTFNVADKGLAMKFSYTYGISATGQSMLVSNPIQGVQPSFQLVLPMGFTSPKTGIRRYATLTLLCCVAEEIAFATKQGDFMVPDFSAEAQENDDGDVFRWDFAEIS